jgi:hypothetical protein
VCVCVERGEEGFKEENNTPHIRKRREANGIGHILRRKYVQKYIIQRKMAIRLEGTVRRGRRLKQLLDGIKGAGGYWELK